MWDFGLSRSVRRASEWMHVLLERIRYGKAATDSARAIDSIRTLRKGRDWRTIPMLLDSLADPSRAVRVEAIAAVRTLWAYLPYSRIRSLEKQVQSRTIQCYVWHSTKLNEIRLRRWPVEIWQLFTFHSSGYVREEALRRIGDTATSMPFVLIRLNDWVTEVRTLAESVVRKHLCARDIVDWLQHVRLVQSLADRRRTSHHWLLDELRRILVAPASRKELRAAVASGDHSIARFAFDAAMRLPPMERHEFLGLGLRCPDPVVRWRAARAVREWRDCPNREALIDAMMADRLMRVRSEALQLQMEEHPETDRALLSSALLDRSASIRSLARFYAQRLRKAGRDVPDERALFVAAIERGKPSELAAAIAGLGECGDEGDLEIVRPFVEHKHEPIAAAAVRAIVALDRSDRTQWLGKMLDDARPQVRRVAFDTLAGGAALPPIADLRELTLNGSSLRTRSYAVRLLLRRSLYDAVPDAVRAARADDEAVARLGMLYLSRCMKSHLPRHGPSQSQLDEARAALAEAGNPLSDAARKAVRVFVGV